MIRAMTDAATGGGARVAPPVPAHLSPEAQRFLATQTRRDTTDPALDDVDGWLAHIAEGDTWILERFATVEFPLDVDDSEIAGVHTYVLRAPDVPDTPETPVFLDIHGGALIIGGGEVCRRMAGATAMVNNMIT